MLMPKIVYQGPLKPTGSLGKVMATNEIGGSKGVQACPTLKSAGDLICLITIPGSCIESSRPCLGWFQMSCYICTSVLNSIKY